MGYGGKKDKPEEGGRGETDEARRERIEGFYRYAPEIAAMREPQLTTIAFVSQNRNELASMFIDWRSGGASPDLGADLNLWESSAFGQRLEPSAHGILLFAVGVAMHKSCGKDCRCRGRYQGVIGPRRTAPPKGDIKKFDEAIGRLARESAMPHAPSRRDRDEREAALREQASAIGG